MTYSRFLQGGKKGGEFPRRPATRVSLVSVAAVLPEVTPVRANVAAVGRMPRRSCRISALSLDIDFRKTAANRVKGVGPGVRPCLKDDLSYPPLAAETCLKGHTE